MSTSVNFDTISRFNHNAGLYQAKSELGRRNFFIVENNGYYELINYGSTLEKAVKMLYYVLNPFVRTGVNPLQSTSNVEKRFEASVFNGTKEMKDLLPELKGQVLKMLAEGNRPEVLEWYINFTTLILENKNRLIGPNDLKIRDVLSPQERTLEEIEMNLAELKEILHKLQDFPSDEESAQEVSALIDQLIKEKDLLLKEKKSAEIHQIYVEYADFEYKILDYFKNETLALMQRFDEPSTSDLEKLQISAKLLARAEPLALCEKYGEEFFKSEDLELEEPKKEELTRFFNSIKEFCEHYRNDYFEEFNKNMDRAIEMFIELHNDENASPFQAFYKLWNSSKRNQRNSSPFMRTAQKAAQALSDAHRKPKTDLIMRWTHWLADQLAMLGTQARALDEGQAALKEHIAQCEREKAAIYEQKDVEENGERNVIDQTFEALRMIRPNAVEKFAGSAFNGFYKVLAQIMHQAHHDSTQMYFKESTLDKEQLRELGFSKTESFTFSNGAFLFVAEFKDLLSQSKAMATAELNRLLSRLQNLRKSFDLLSQSIESHPEHARYQGKIEEVEAEVDKLTKPLVDWAYDLSFNDREEEPSLELLKNQFDFLKQELASAKEWQPGYFNLFTSKEQQIAENNKKIESLQKVIQDFSTQIDKIESLITYRDLLVKKTKIARKIDKKETKNKQNQRIAAIHEYLKIVDVFENGINQALALKKHKTVSSDKIRQAQQNEKDAKAALEENQMQLEDTICAKGKYLSLQEEFKMTCARLHLE
jgi:hypothetical protein